MGVTYKLIAKIKEFIINKKIADPRLSCRKLVNIINKKFHITLSKSSVNNIIKQSKLSSPVGRRQKKKRTSVVENDGLGAFLLKAVDLYLGGSVELNELIEKRLDKKNDPCLLQALLYLPLFTAKLDPQDNRIIPGLYSLIGKEYAPRDLLSYLSDLQSVKLLEPEITRAIARVTKQAWLIKLTFPDNSLVYIDGELRTIWSTPHIPYDFSSTLYNSKSYINRRFNDNLLIILFTAQGYDIVPKEFFNFLQLQHAFQSKLIKITLYGSKMEELETLSITDYDKIDYIFGLWPWQFERYRQIRIKGEFRLLYFEPLQANFYIAEAEIILTQPKANQSVKLRGCVLKEDPTGKIRLIIVTNLPGEGCSLENIALYYLNRWPEPEQSFADFSHKIELFTYTASSHKLFSIEELAPAGQQPAGAEGALESYLRCLDLFLRWHILPTEYEESDFSTTKQRFYQLRARIRDKKDYLLVSFFPPKDYSFQKDLAYACQRLNEKGIALPDKKRLWFNIA